jgi:hypothetical protein
MTIYLPDQQLGGKFADYTLDNNQSVSRVGTAGAFRLRYEDPLRENRFDVVATPVTAPIVWPGSSHVDQVVANEGTLVLRGKHHAVKSFGFRNRSWGDVRREDPNGLPPIGRMSGVFHNDFMFNMMTFEHPDLKPCWIDKLRIDPDKTLKFGWMKLGDELVSVRSARTLVCYSKETILPESIEIHASDARKREYVIRGTVVAGAPISYWLNVRTSVCQVRWTCNNESGWGEIVNVQGNDFLFHECSRRTAPA